MQTVKTETASALPPILSLDDEKRTTLPTGEAARHLNRRPQTLRGWACLETGPIRPIRISGRLAWRVADIKRVLSGEA